MTHRVRVLVPHAATLSLLIAPSMAHDLPTLYVPRDSQGLPNNSRIQRLSDGNGDGAYSGAAEVTWHYDYPSGPGSSLFGPNLELICAPDGALFVADLETARIYRTRDANGDGDVNDAGEITLFFNGLSAPQYPASVQRLAIDNAGALWFATADHPAFGGLDRIIRLIDLNADGDSSDAGEYTVVWWPVLASPWSFAPRGVLTGARGELYCFDEGNGLGNAGGPGVYRLEDRDGDGLFVTEGEREFVFSTADYFGLEVPWVRCAPDGSLFVFGHNLPVLRAEDRDHDGFFAPSEVGSYVSYSAALEILQVQPGFGSRIYYFAGSVLYVAEDLNGNGVIDIASERRTLWVGGSVSPRGFAVERGEFQPPPRPYCTAGTSQAGCSPTLRASGRPSGSSTAGFALQLTDAPQQRQALLFYGLAPASAPWGPTSFKCVTPPIQRAFAGATGGASACDGALSFDWNQYLAAHPLALGAPFGAGDTFYAQGWSRDAGANPAGVMSNGLEVTLLP